MLLSCSERATAWHQIGTQLHPSLVVAAFPFVARLVEGSIREVDKGMLEAAQSMGCSPFQIITKVLLPESRPSLITGFTTAFITILSYGAMAGAIGGGGLGSMALMLGYQRRMYIVMYVSVLVLVILVQIFQTVGTHMPSAWTGASPTKRRAGAGARTPRQRSRRAAASPTSTIREPQSGPSPGWSGLFSAK